MEYLTRIEGLAARAAAINMSLHELSQRADVRYHMLHRWRVGEVVPTVRVLERDLSKLEAKLDECEAAMYARLAKRFEGHQLSMM